MLDLTYDSMNILRMLLTIHFKGIVEVILHDL